VVFLLSQPQNLFPRSFYYFFYIHFSIKILGVAPEKTIKLSVNEAARNAITAQLGHLPLAGEALAGSFAGMMQVTVTNPLEVVKVRMQTSNMSLRDVLQQIHSFKDLYIGAAPCVVRDMTFSAILFPTYAHVKVALATAIATGNSGGMTMFWANMIAGSVAAAPAAIIATPVSYN
jgi:solute carrier family 25 aspartate/glutamate transporter 12/13